MTCDSISHLFSQLRQLNLVELCKVPVIESGANSSMFSSLVVVVFSAWFSTSAADLSSEFAHHAVLDPGELMKLYWTVDWEKETVSFAVEAATTGWVGFGFSSGNGGMVGSDVVIGWVKDSEGYLTVSVDVFIDTEHHTTPLKFTQKGLRLQKKTHLTANLTQYSIKLKLISVPPMTEQLITRCVIKCQAFAEKSH